MGARSWARHLLGVDMNYYEVVGDGSVLSASWLSKSNVCVRNLERACGVPDERWDLFGGCYCSKDVQDKAREMGIRLVEPLLSPMRDDELAPESFDDLDAAQCALEAGVRLVKLPDEIGSTLWRYYVVD